MKTALQQFLEDFNKAFAENNTEYIIDNVTKTIRWNVVGDFTVEGIDAFSESLKTMTSDDPLELTIHNVITHGKSAAVNGEMKSPDGRVISFCDIYKLSGFKNPKISELTSYAFDLSK